MKVSVLWSQLADYSLALFRAMAVSESCELQLFYLAEDTELTFSGFDVSFCRKVVRFANGISAPEVARQVEAFRPDCILMSGWNFSEYMRTARVQRRRGVVTIAAMDNPWRGDLRQRIGCLVSPLLLHPAIDALFVAGERQMEFARRLGYRNAFAGVYAANVGRFGGIKLLEQRPNRFLFVGRLIERKGIRMLLAAHRRYCATVGNPMPLRIAGTGPLETLCRDVPGVELCGFVQPEELAAFFAQGRCLLLPSHVEHWGVTLHEAAAAGLPLIATGACAATVNFLRDGANGYLIVDDENSLYEALVAFHETPDAIRQSMSQVSRQLALSWTPEMQARHFVRHARKLTTGRA